MGKAKMKWKVENLILGAGIAGLACANQLQKRGKSAMIFEAKEYGGGYAIVLE